MRVMAIDYGDTRTGVAVSDATGTVVGFTAVVTAFHQEQAAEEIARLVEVHRPDRLVLGFPRNMDGTEGQRAERYRAFGALLAEKSGLTPVLWDERRTTIEAHNILSANGKRMKKHKKTVDAVAAALILEGYLGSL